MPYQRLSITLILMMAAVMSAVLPCPALSAKESSELDFILSCNPMQDLPSPHRGNAGLGLSGTSEVKLLLIGAIRFYQRFISTQDAPACNFVPSCSQFGAESIGQLGAFRGILLTSDRLQRCNSMSISRYQMDHKSGKLVDPVRIYTEIIR